MKSRKMLVAAIVGLCSAVSLFSQSRPVLSVTGSIAFTGHYKSGSLSVTFTNTGSQDAKVDFEAAGHFGIFAKRPSKYDSVKAIAPYVCQRADEGLKIAHTGTLKPGLSITAEFDAGWETDSTFHPEPFRKGERPDNIVGCIAYSGPDGSVHHLQIFAFVRYAADSADLPHHFDAEKIEIVKIVDQD
jgi:hypothetical protein